MLFKVICQYLFQKNQNNLVVKYSFYKNRIFTIVKVAVGEGQENFLKNTKTPLHKKQEVILCLIAWDNLVFILILKIVLNSFLSLNIQYSFRVRLNVI